MKRITIIVASFVVLAGMACAGPFGIFPLAHKVLSCSRAPTIRWAEVNIPGCNMNPNIHKPGALGVQAGDSIQITGIGGLCF